MHTVDSAIKHALGMSTRKRGNVVIEEYVQLTNLRKRVTDLCTYIMDKPFKSRFEVMKRLSQEIWMCECSKFEIPNGTGVVGFHGMLQSLIRNKHLIECVQTYNSEQFIDLPMYALTEEEWLAVAQIECILKKIRTLNKNIQSDIPG
jgi:hypothetical protein